MKVEKMEAEINQLKSHLALLEKRLKEVQQNCDHHFCKSNPYYEQCIKCNKVNVLYY